MSGNGRGGSDGAPSNGHTCPTVFTGARLVSSKEAALTSVKTGDILDLRVIQANTFILMASNNGEDAGAVSHTATTQIIKCIQDGHTYVAYITKRDGGNIELEIRMVNA
jgi:hypothetical protein